jgi:HD-GYP domain-containing protein (c-di-GMP phosphodiesterase class II)
MGLAGEALHELEMSSILHDVGKIGIDDKILRKPGMLDPDEREAMEQHPVIGAAIIDPIPLSDSVKRSVRHHQERWDGKGYPDRLEGEAIPLYARITAVADAWDTITSNRPYRNGRSVEVAVPEITRCSGTQFDPTVVDAFLRVVARVDAQQFTQAGIRTRLAAETAFPGALPPAAPPGSGRSGEPGPPAAN